MRLWSLHPRYLDSKGLTAAWREALLARAGQTRGFAFDKGKLPAKPPHARLTITRGQLAFELRHLRSKLHVRDPGRLRQLPRAVGRIDAHPLFRAIAGSVEAWERGEGSG
ncbi:MAG TPA: pyrimidine dimer DNA glycosylase/endonuclease V [Rhodanobacteraceae bacterium]|nr:pyrimidine dimer DNA glycosylase/endonuclease V [Rhodanobacteraceae bacterium]